MKKFVHFTTAAIFVISMLVVPNAFADEPTWTFVGKNAVEGNEDIKHYKWEMERPPYGPWDKIALHQLTYEGWYAWPTKNEVILVIPGTWSRFMESSDPTTSTNLFLAHNKYHVFTVDFRTAYQPNKAYDQFDPDDLMSTAEWTYGAFREDIKAAVDKAKKITKAKKIFLAGRSRGGTQMYIYASKYWEEDLKGLIGLDGGGITYNNGNPADQIPAALWPIVVAQFKAGLLPPPLDELLSEVGSYEQSQYAGAVPTSTNMVGETSVADYAATVPPPPDGSTLETVSDVIAYGAYYSWGAGNVTNYYAPYPGGEGETYMDLEPLIQIMSNFTRYWPSIQNLEGSQLSAYEQGTCPFLDYHDHLSEVDLPIAYFGGKLGCGPGCSYCTYATPNKTASTDVTVVCAPEHGHLDVYAGTHSLELVKQPLLDWMNARKK
jgi:pimeloyl-ACP methyl ester carboxylesterase